MQRTVRDEILYSIDEAKKINMGTDAPSVKIIEHAAKLAMVPVDWVELVYYDMMSTTSED